MHGRINLVGATVLRAANNPKILHVALLLNRITIEESHCLMAPVYLKQNLSESDRLSIMKDVRLSVAHSQVEIMKKRIDVSTVDFLFSEIQGTKEK